MDQTQRQIESQFLHNVQANDAVKCKCDVPKLPINLIGFFVISTAPLWAILCMYFVICIEALLIHCLNGIYEGARSVIMLANQSMSLID